MINIPFNSNTFSKDMKPKISGNNLNLEYENIESTLSKVAVDFYKYISEDQYNDIVKKESTISSDKLNTAYDYLQRSMLHFAMYHHVIYLISKISNDGITVKKSDTETTIYKYQQDKLENKLLSDAWFWLNELICYIDKNSNDFTKWKDSDQKKQFSEIPVTIDDFQKWVGVSDICFLIFSSWIIREVWNECVNSRISAEKYSSASVVVKDKFKKALCYEVMARSINRLSFYCLPEPVRIDVNNEMSKSNEPSPEARKNIADIYEIKAKTYWTAIDADNELKSADVNSDTISDKQFNYNQDLRNEKFVCS